MIVLRKNMTYNYKYYGSCNECKQYNTDYSWCPFCNARHFRQYSENWTSENRNLDNFILNTQVGAEKRGKILEWIEYKNFKNVKHLVEEESGITFRAVWKGGPINNWDYENNQWKRTNKNLPVILKCFHNSLNITKCIINVRIFFIHKVSHFFY
jgi:hypothetical protein